ncbi:MAG: STAS domain-containing protein [Planctomycetota bacterium]
MDQTPFSRIACAHDTGIAHVTFPAARFGGTAVRELFELSNQLPGPQPKLLVDTTGLALVPSGGMGILITIRKRFLSLGGQLHIALPDPALMESFRVANMDRILELFESVEQARSAFKL